MGLAYPVCAAVCPRGIGSCPYPGPCFLFTDLDANALCDYTGRSIAGTAPVGSTSAPPVTTPTALQTTVQPTVLPTTVPTASATTVAPVTPPTGTATGLVPVSALLAGLLVALAAGLAAFFLLRSGRYGTQGPGPALALSCFVGLGAGLITAHQLSGQAASASLFATTWLLAGSVLGAYAWRRGAVTRPIALALAGLAALFGFAVLAPLMPIEFVGLVTVAAGGGSPLTPGVAGVLGAIVIAFAVGRTFCAHACPVGAVQELAYAAPVRKYVVRHPRTLEVLRAGVFAVSVIAALSLVNLLACAGVYDFFSVSVSIGFAVFAGLLALAAVVYRPVCRGLCPFGLLFSLPAHVSRWRLRRTDACIDCRRCERACPAGVAGRGVPKRECYLCGRCIDACRVRGALGYGPGTERQADEKEGRIRARPV